MRYFSTLDGILVESLRWYRRVMNVCKMKSVTVKELRKKGQYYEPTGKTYKLTSKGLEEVV